MRKVLTSAAVMLAVAGCSPGQPTFTPVATTHDVPRDTSGIAARFTNDIWPAIKEYSHYQYATNKLRAIVDPAVLDDDKIADSAEALGGSGYDNAIKVMHYADDRRLISTNVTAINGGTATVIACYSYTYIVDVGATDKKEEPRSSEATMELVNIDNLWYLHAITDDHVVPDCPAQ